MRRFMAAALTAAAALLLVVSHVAAYVPTITKPYRERSEEEVRRMFAEFKVEHGRAYGSAGEEERRYAIFKDTLRAVDAHNANPDAGYTQGINFFADLTDEDFPPGWPGDVGDLHGGEADQGQELPASSGNVDRLPDSVVVDGMKKGWVAEAKRLLSM